MEDERYKLYKDYLTIHVKSNHLEQDSKDLDDVIRVHSEDGYILHSVIPRISDGETEGYILIFDSTNVD
ncbi:hypothetical protein ABEP00_17075 [Heyndrickxia sporothermodurans]|uniref:hypothetical protein n=1 Tax=Heyndrickxia sporothermodurans TaxID=46224 RepID=UPI0007171E21